MVISIIWECNCDKCNIPHKKIKKQYPQKIHEVIENVHAIKMNIFTNIRMQIYGYAQTKEKIYVLITDLKDAKTISQTVLNCRKASWIQLDNEPQELFDVKKSTERTELWVLVSKVEFDNPLHNIENQNPRNNEFDLTFTLIPIIM